MNCSTDMHLAVKYADDILTTGTETQIRELREAVHILFELRVNTSISTSSGEALTPKIPPAAAMRLFNIASLLAYAVKGTSINYQSHGFAISLQPFCNYLEQYNPAYSKISDPHSILSNPRNASATASGIAATYNASTAFEALLSATYQKMLDDNHRRPFRFARADSTSWAWQYCSEFGFVRPLPVSLIH